MMEVSLLGIAGKFRQHIDATGHLENEFYYTESIILAM
jgi:hypothetical protein